MSNDGSTDSSAGADGSTDFDFDFAEPVLGFRIWALGDDGKLRGAAHDQLWVPGENVAVCRARSPHPTAPVAGCRCGFNALHAHAPVASHYGPGYVAGAVAAWGDIEWHRTGFRAERACVLALCDDDHESAQVRATIARAALRYGVEVVPRNRLIEHASQFARSLAPAVPQLSRRLMPPAAVPDPRSTGRAGSRGYWIGHHVVAEFEDRDLAIGLGSALARRIGSRSRLVSVVPGSAVAAGEAVAVLHTGSGSYSLDAPHAGTVLAVNEEVLAEPSLAAADMSEGGWVVKLRGSEKVRSEDSPLIWGRRGREGYERFVVRVGPERMLDEIALSRHIACVRVACAGDAVALMRERLNREAARAKSRYQAAA